MIAEAVEWLLCAAAEQHVIDWYDRTRDMILAGTAAPEPPSVVAAFEVLDQAWPASDELLAGLWPWPDCGR